jgi:hypothetical protein
MISIYRCKLTDGEWCRIGRHATSLGFTLLSEAVVVAEALNAREWPIFDWLREPVEAFLAIRVNGRVSPCEDDAGRGDCEEE